MTSGWPPCTDQKGSIINFPNFVPKPLVAGFGFLELASLITPYEKAKILLILVMNI